MQIKLLYEIDKMTKSSNQKAKDGYCKDDKRAHTYLLSYLCTFGPFTVVHVPAFQQKEDKEAQTLIGLKQNHCEYIIL